ncbi:hypothetical protein V0288_22435 [Pannus brasiliensis CCIBt3594]|uniref:Uncharacterized protein n=1 Tax=Pannus brasiliensis CCIBt3594 TaxID=1427578 RepID=A0AAW9QYV9_9CHRO
MPTSNVVVLGIERRSYFKRGTNEEVVNCRVFYYKTQDKHNSRLERGFFPLVMDVHPDFGISDFESDFPAVYDFKSCLRRDLRSGKGIPVLQEIEFIDNVIVDKSDGFLVLGAKKLDFTTEDGSRYRGIKLFYLDVNGYQVSDDAVGLLPIEQNIADAKFDIFQRLPAYYDLDFGEVRGRGGSSVIKLFGAKFKAPWNHGSSQESSDPSLFSTTQEAS